MEERKLDCLVEKMSTLWVFVGEVMDYLSKGRDYGTGEKLTMAEIHTLSRIADRPGLRVTDVARAGRRTIGAASRNVDRLERKGYVEKRKLPDNQKNICLYPTAAGKELAELHGQYDRERLRAAAGRLLEEYSEEELETFLRVLNSLYGIIKEENQ